MFAHSLIIRVITVRYLGLPASCARNLQLSPGAVCVLGYDVIDDARVISTWNDRSHLIAQPSFA